jgi:uncharacterized membrane protein YfcA
MSLDYWYIFPVAVLFATIAMASGIGGATFFSPFFIIALGIEPEVAIGTGLITEVFGFASGLIAYARKKLIDYRLGIQLLIVTIPLSIVGTLAAGLFAEDVLKVVLGVGLFAVAASFIRAPDHHEVRRIDKAIHAEFGGENAETCLITAEGEQVCYTVCNRNEGRLLAGVGGLFVGLISTGLGEINGYFLMQRCKVPSKISIATSVFVVAITALAASAGHLLQFTQAGSETLNLVSSLVIFTVPGVILGAQLGSRAAALISQRTLERGLGVLFILVGALTLGEVIL